MNFYFYHPVHFEKWDWRAVERGIGGSETHQIEMTQRLARRGHSVISYAPVPKSSIDPHGVRWLPLEKADFSKPGVWIIYRSPETMDKFTRKDKNQIRWLVSQDEYYQTWTDERIKKLDKVLALCGPHAKSLSRRQPLLEPRLIISSNGLRMDLVREVEKLGIKRNPKKIIYASSPDRGLKYTLETFKRAREYVPDIELHVFYGFNNINKLIKMDPAYGGFARYKDEVQDLLKQPGVHWRGRVGQRQLYKEWLSAGIWLYQTNFTETSCIVCMEAQALGAVPITNPLWALAENVMAGVVIDGNAYDDKLVKAKYVAELVRLTSQPSIQENIRPVMMERARMRFNWERIVDAWEKDLLKLEGICDTQYAFQHKHAKGKILNVGCDIDASGFKQRGAVNVDILETSPLTQIKNPVDILADARDLPPHLWRKFDSVVLGDILEHMNDGDIVKSLVSAKKCLKKGGKIVITCPNDYRPVPSQHRHSSGGQYVQDISSHHERPISRKLLESLVKKAGLSVHFYQELDYTHFIGHGIVAA